MQSRERDLPIRLLFFINESKDEAMNEVRKKIADNCSDCVYKCPIAPKKLSCIKNKCYPDIQDKSTFFYWGTNCEKIVELYSPDIIGKKFADLNLYVLDYELLYETEVDNYKKSSNLIDNNLKFIIGKTGRIETIKCLEREPKY